MVRYTLGEIPPVPAVIALYQAAGLKRPVDDPARIAAMYRHSNLVVTAWDGEQLVGVSRALSDFAYCCYLSDLAVLPAWQGQGIGRELVARTRAAAGPGSMLLLLAAPGAMSYYPALGFDTLGNAFQLPRTT